MKKSSMVWPYLSILSYLTLNIIILSRHEPWGDEAQAWLIARDLDLPSIFKQMAHEGTPALWHMLLVPLAKTGLPDMFEFILHLVIATAAVTVFVLYAPFSRVTKVLFILSHYMAYEYSIIARSYSLSILLLFLIAAFYEKRFEHPLRHAFLILLLFNTNVHSFFIASSLSSLFGWELYKNRINGHRLGFAMIFIIMNGFIAFLQLLSPPDDIHYGLVSNVNYLAPFAAIAYAFFPYLPGKKFWYAGIEDYGTFVTDNKNFFFAGRTITNEQIILRSEKTFPDRSKRLLLLTRSLNMPESQGFRLLYKVDRVFGYCQEKFYLYELVSR